MEIFDVSQEIFECEVYPGDSTPKKTEDLRISRGDIYNLSSFSMGAHNGTHIDAPFHFFEDGDTIEHIPLKKTVGACYVCEENGEITKEKALEILAAAQAKSPECAKRILIKGKGSITLDAGKIFAAADIYLLGVEGISVGDAAAPMAIHKALLDKKIVLLEGLRLASVDEGLYFLAAQPLKLKGLDGAPCRAILLKK